MSDDLLKRLRDHEEQQQVAGHYWWETPEVCVEAADRIEELEGQLSHGSFYKESDIDALQNRIAELEAENLRLRKCLEHTREEICEGPVEDVLWHTAMPSCTTVDNITLTLNDGWTYDGWLQAKEEQTGGQDRWVEQ